MLTEESLQDIFEIAELLSNGDKELFLHLRQVVFAKHPDHVLDMMESSLEKETFDDFLDRITESEKDNLWLILLYLLEKDCYIASISPSISLADFVEKFDRLQQVREAGISLKLDAMGLTEKEELADWGSLLNYQLAAEGYVVATVARDASWQAIFLTKEETWHRLVELVEKLGYPLARLDRE